MAYRYRGKISRSAKVLPKIGTPTLVQGYRYLDGDGDAREVVIVKGDAGIATFTGGEWGYEAGVTLPVVDLLVALGLHLERAENAVFMSRRYDEPGVDWLVKFLANNRVLVLQREQVDALREVLPLAIGRGRY